MSFFKKLTLLCLDLAAFYGALIIAILARYGEAEFALRLGDHLAPFSLLFPIWILSLAIFDLYRQKSMVNLNAIANRLMIATLSAVLTSIVLFYLFGGIFRLTPRANLALFAILFFVLDYAFRSLFRKAVAVRPVDTILVGNSKSMRELEEFLKESSHTGYRVIKRLKSLKPGDTSLISKNSNMIGGYTLVIESRLTQNPAIARELYRLLPAGVAILSFSDFYELMFERIPLDELEEGWFIKHVATKRTLYDGAKRLIDITVSFSSLILLLPLGFLVGALIRLTSPGPAVFRQLRIGKNNREFVLYKFRTMNTWNGGLDGTPAWTLRKDPRVTTLGKILRATKLDELPQLWNILRGDISLTGPRPESAELAKKFAAFPYYEMRHVVQPGLTGWAQINYRASASDEEALVKLAYDIYYIKNRSFLLDLAILMKTIKYFFTRPE